MRIWIAKIRITDESKGDNKLTLEQLETALLTADLNTSLLDVQKVISLELELEEKA